MYVFTRTAVGGLVFLASMNSVLYNIHVAHSLLKAQYRPQPQSDDGGIMPRRSLIGSSNDTTIAISDVV